MSKSPKPESAVFSVRVVPRSSQNKIEVLDSGSLKVWITAPPVDGEANAAVCEMIAKALGITRAQVEVMSGATSRNKQIRVTGIGSSEAIARILPGKSA